MFGLKLYIQHNITLYKCEFFNKLTPIDPDYYKKLQTFSKLLSVVIPWPLILPL